MSGEFIAEKVRKAAMPDGGPVTMHADELERHVLEAVRQRDNEWCAELESGYSDLPPRSPGFVGSWWAALVGRIHAAATKAERERRDAWQIPEAGGPGMARAIGRAAMQVVVECDEQTGPDGLCECGRWVASMVMKGRAERRRS